MHPRLSDHPLHGLLEGPAFRRRSRVPGVDGADPSNWQANLLNSFVEQ